MIQFIWVAFNAAFAAPSTEASVQSFSGHFNNDELPLNDLVQHLGLQEELCDITGHYWARIFTDGS